jgi:hypothetical protein
MLAGRLVRGAWDLVTRKWPGFPNPGYMSCRRDSEIAPERSRHDNAMQLFRLGNVFNNESG